MQEEMCIIPTVRWKFRMIAVKIAAKISPAVVFIRGGL